ncbi:alpha/beta-hydrolase [Thozetella sp. PMI_491]|nr:alpha/beta-hydrolase [Thozetella sp. PMI_491]
MHTSYHCKTGAAADIPTSSPKPIVSISPVVIPSPDRLVDLELRITVPISGDALPIVIFSHGQGSSYHLSSLEGYAPLVEFWAGHGFAVIQPTHLSSSFLGLRSPPGEKLFMLRQRVADISRILDGLSTMAAGVPMLEGRLDHSRVAVAGHSLGGLTAAFILGASNTDPRDGFKLERHENRVKTGVIMAGPGRGGDALNEGGKRALAFYGPDFSTMTTPAMVVTGDEDHDMAGLTDCGPIWQADPFLLSMGPKDLLTIKGAQHSLGGIQNWDSGEKDHENPLNLGIVQRMTWAYLRSQLYDGDTSYEEALTALRSPALESQAKVENKQ